jgi:hypothetical protein
MSQLLPNYAVLFESYFIDMTVKETTAEILDEANYKTYDYIKTRYPDLNETNYRNIITEKCTLVNEDAHTFLQSNMLYSSYSIIQNQTVIPCSIPSGIEGEFINVIKYVCLYMPMPMIMPMPSNQFIVALVIDLNYVNPSFFTNFKYYFPQEITSCHKDSLSNYIYSITKTASIEERRVIKKQVEKNNLFIKLILSYAQFHFDAENRIYETEKYAYEKIMNIITSYVVPPISINYAHAVSTKLFSFQEKDVAWMADIEFRQRKFILDDARVIAFGNNHEIVFTDSCNQHADYTLCLRRDISNYPPEKLNYFIGGCLASAPGLGKTLSVLTYCAMQSDSLSLVSVPEHLVTHWISEYKKHINKVVNFYIYSARMPGMPDFTDINNPEIVISEIPTSGIILASYTATAGIKFATDRIIIDEFHELEIIDGISTAISLAKFHWCITATPFIAKDTCYNILNYVVANRLNNPNVIKYEYYHGIIASLFKTSSDVDFALAIPAMCTEIVTLLDFSTRETIMMESIAQSNFYLSAEEHQQRLLKFCMYPNLFLDKGILDFCFSDKDFIDILKKDYELMYQKFISTMRIMPDIKEEDFIDDFNVREFLNNISSGIITTPQAIDDIILMQKKLRDLKVHIKFVEMQLARINKRIVINEAVIDEVINDEVINDEVINDEVINDILKCSICYDNINPDFTMLQCGHIFCSACIKQSIDYGHKECSLCKYKFIKSTCYRIKQGGNKDDIIELYGTKIAHLVLFCKDHKEEKIIIYLHDERLIEDLPKILQKAGITAKNIDDQSLIEFNDVHGSMQVLILSSKNNASGLCLQVSNIIILLQPIPITIPIPETISGINIKQTEMQIIGRCLRIGQKRPVALYRFIIANSIEEEIFKASRMRY